VTQTADVAQQATTSTLTTIASSGPLNGAPNLLTIVPDSIPPTTTVGTIAQVTAHDDNGNRTLPAANVYQQEGQVFILDQPVGVVTYTVTYVATTPRATVSPTSIDFGAAPTGTSVTRTVTITNTGHDGLQVSGVTLDGSSAFVATVPSSCANLSRDSSCAISVRFNPDAAGVVTATLSVNDNAPDAPQTVALTGTGVVANTATNTAEPTSTGTAVPTDTNTTEPTSTGTTKPTSTNTAEPTSTGTATPTSTGTTEPTSTSTTEPTSTATTEPTSTNTTEPTSTNTTEPTSTNTTEPTSTNTTEPTSTNTTEPTSTNTTEPTSTNTTEPTSTNTTEPTSTNTTQPTNTGTAQPTSTQTPAANVQGL